MTADAQLQCLFAFALLVTLGVGAILVYVGEDA